MPNTFFSSDHHLGHENIIKFIHWDGTLVRPGFSCVDEMNEHIIDRHNSVVKDKDTVYFLGDFAINRRYLKLISRFKGRKRLILGNHDIFKNKDYFNNGIEELLSFKKFEGFVATHIPVHRESLRPSWSKNVHGHLHRDRVKITRGFNTSDEIDPDYINVCVEQLDDYTPISIDDLRSKF